MCLYFLKVINFLNPVVLCSDMLSLERSSSSDLLNFYRCLSIIVVNLIGMKYFTCTLTDSFSDRQYCWCSRGGLCHGALTYTGISL